jgi:endonuclease/exonuclease/phosphatase (EEP) superfamily protein YafD
MSAGPTHSKKSFGQRLNSALQVLATFWLAGAVVVTAATLGARTWWVGDVLANLRIQILLALLPLLLLTLGLRSYRQLGLVLALLLWHGSFLRSAVIPAVARESNSSAAMPAALDQPVQTLSICLANVWMGNTDYPRICNTFRESRADLLAVVELSDGLQAAIDAQFAAEYPYFLAKANETGAFGIGLWSRYPLAQAKFVNFAVREMPSIFAEVEVGDRRTRIIVTHPVPPIFAVAWKYRNDHLQAMVNDSEIKWSEKSPMRTVIVGDFNLTPWSPLYSQLLEDVGLLDAAAGAGVTPTWYRWPLFPCGLVLDHVWYSPNLRCLQRRILPEMGSDHRPVFVEFGL